MVTPNCKADCHRDHDECCSLFALAVLASSGHSKPITTQQRVEWLVNIWPRVCSGNPGSMLNNIVRSHLIIETGLHLPTLAQQWWSGQKARSFVLCVFKCLQPPTYGSELIKYLHCSMHAFDGCFDLSLASSINHSSVCFWMDQVETFCWRLKRLKSVDCI